MDSQRDPVEKLAEEFLDRRRRGERPTIAEYTAKHPDLAQEIRDVFPALLHIEELADSDDSDDSEDSPLGPPSLSLENRQLRELGEYRILREVGRGGMGWVFEAEQVSLGRRVALKLLPVSSRTSPRSLERFRREAHAAARLRHPHIVPVYGVGEDQGLHYFTMQFIQGAPLNDVLKEIRAQRGIKTSEDPSVRSAQSPLSTRIANLLQSGGGHERQTTAYEGSESSTDDFGSLPDRSGRQDTTHSVTRNESTANDPAKKGLTRRFYYRRIAQLGVHVAEALSCAHREGILHRDIKPSNLLLDTAGEVWVTDFGLAKAADEQEELTRTGDVLGTLPYMPRERFQGWSDPRSDIYGLGLTIYECLTLRRAFTDTDRHRLTRRIMEENPPPPRAIDRNIPRDLETIVLKMIEKDPANRYATAFEAAEDLQSFLAGRSIAAHPTTRLERAWRWCRRNPVTAGLGTTAAIALLVIAIGSVLTAFWLQEAWIEAQKRLYESLVAQSEARQLSGEFGQRFESLDALRQAADLAPRLSLGEAEVLRLRNEAIACLTLPDLRIDRKWPATQTGWFNKIGYDADLKRYARLEPGGDIVVRRLVDNAELSRLPGLGHLGAGEDPAATAPLIDFSPDTRFLAVKGTGRDGGTYVRLWEWRTRRSLLKSSAGGDVRTRNMDFGPEGRLLAFFSQSGSLEIYTIVGNEEPTAELSKSLSRGDSPSPTIVRFSPCAQMLAVGISRNPGLIEALNLEGDPLQTLTHSARVYDLAWSPDSRFVATACDDRNAYVWDVETGERVGVLSGHDHAVIHVSFSHGGDLVATTGWGDKTYLWDPLTGERLVTARGSGRQFSRNDGFLAFASDINGRFEVAAGSECRVRKVFSERSQVWGLDYSPDGRVLAAAGDDARGSRSVQLVDSRTARSLAVLPVTHARSVLFEPSGKHLITGGRGGVYRWPITSKDAATSTSWTIGAPDLIVKPQPDGSGWLGLSRDGCTLVAGFSSERAVALDLEAPGKGILLGPHPGNLWAVAVSPDGKWAALGSWGPGPVTVWSVANGELVRQLPAAKYGRVAFSPAGRWLVTPGERCQLWSTVTWELEGEVSGWGFRSPVAFTPDEQLLAVADRGALASLLAPSRGTLLASLSTPAAPLENPASLAFSRDSSQLVAGTFGGGLVFWDLGLVRSELAEMALDWEAPAQMPPARDPSPGSVMVKLENPELDAAHQVLQRKEHPFVSPGSPPAAFVLEAAEPNRWIDLLAGAQPAVHAVSGVWNIADKGLSVAPSYHCRWNIPFMVRGGYRLRAEFTRLAGENTVGFILPVGDSQVMLALDHAGRRVSGLDLLEGVGAGEPTNPSNVYPGRLATKKRYSTEVTVRPEDDVVEICALLDDTPHLYWRGPRASLSMWPGWKIHPKAFGLAASGSRVVFHRLELGLLDGHALRIDVREEKLPRGQPVDALKLVDPALHAVHGTWRRDGEALQVKPEIAARIMIPLHLPGSYKLKVRFTQEKTPKGKDVVVMLPVGAGACTLHTSIGSHEVGGLGLINGRPAHSDQNPTKRPSRIVNGRIHELVATVRIRGDGAELEVTLDDEPYSRWTGPQESLSPPATHAIPDRASPGLGAWGTKVEFHQLELEMLDGGQASVWQHVEIPLAK